jgi:hypothetical protein
MSIVRSIAAAVASTLCLMLAGCLSTSGDKTDSGVWFDCVLSSAKRTATNPGSPSEIADAAIGECKSQENDFAQKIHVLYPAASPAISAWRDDIRARAVAAIVEIRSAH